MPTKKTKSNTAKSYLKRKPHFAVWIVVLGILLIAVVGVVIIRFSHAGEAVSRGVLYPTMQDAGCSVDPNVKSVHICDGELASTPDGTAWRTSVNRDPGWRWFGPYEKLTAWPDNSSKSIMACVTFRDNAPVFGFHTKYVLDIVAQGHGVGGGDPLASRTIVGQDQASKTTNNSLTVQCVTASVSAQGFPNDLNNVEYRVKVIKDDQGRLGSLDIFNMTRSLYGTITSNVNLPSQLPAKSPCPDGSTDAGDAQLYGQNRTLTGTTIHLCKVDNIYVNVSIAKNLIDMRGAAASAGISLPMVIGYRSFDEQLVLRQQNCPGVNVYTAPSSACNPPTAIPGTSNHQKGEAVDFADVNSQRFNWLKQNAAKFHFYNYPPEQWHWSLTGN